MADRKPLTITFLKDQLDGEIAGLTIIAEADHTYSKQLLALQAWRVSLDLLEEPLQSFLRWLRTEYVLCGKKIAIDGIDVIKDTDSEIIEQYNNRNKQ